MSIYFKKLVCKKCGHIWIPKISPTHVLRCPDCKNERWKIDEKITCPNCDHTWSPKTSTFKAVGEIKFLRCSNCAKQLLVTKKKATKTKITYIVSCNS